MLCPVDGLSEKQVDVLWDWIDGVTREEGEDEECPTLE